MYFSAAKSNYEDTLSSVNDSASVEGERKDQMNCEKSLGLYKKNKCDGVNKNLQECEWLQEDIDLYCFKNHVKPLIALFILALLRNLMF